MKLPTCNHKHEIKNLKWDELGIIGNYCALLGSSGKHWENYFPRYRIFARHESPVFFWVANKGRTFEHRLHKAACMKNAKNAFQVIDIPRFEALYKCISIIMQNKNTLHLKKYH